MLLNFDVKVTKEEKEAMQGLLDQHLRAMMQKALAESLFDYVNLSEGEVDFMDNTRYTGSIILLHPEQLEYIFSMLNLVPKEVSEGIKEEILSK